MIRAIDKWLPAYVMRERPPEVSGPLHVMLAVCDHFEPRHAMRDQAHALERVNRWRDTYPSIVDGFLDADGQPPRHSFFYPIEQYDAELLAPIETLCRAGFGEMEIHLHHHNDNAESTAAALRQGVLDLRRHGAIARDRDGRDAYCFIHGNWSLANCGGAAGCGVDDEIRILLETGCCVDMTFPSAPHPTQPRLINKIAYIDDRVPAEIDKATPAAVGYPLADNQLLMIQGPLGLDWARRKAGVVPKMETGDLTGVNPPTLHRFKRWLSLAPWIPGRPDWRFVKLHTHGGIERNMAAHLSETRSTFHREIAEYAAQNNILLHYVTAREMVNIAHAAIDGKEGGAGTYRNYRYQLVDGQ